MNATCNKKSFLHVDEVSVDSGTSNSGLCVDRTEKFIVLDVRNEFEKIAVFFGLFVVMTAGWVGWAGVFVVALLALDNNSVCFGLLVSASQDKVEGWGEGDEMVAFRVLLPLEKISVFLGFFVGMTADWVVGARLFIVALLALDNNSVCLDLLVSVRHEKVDGKVEGDGIVEIIVFLALEKVSVFISPFNSILVEVGAGEVNSLRIVIVGLRVMGKEFLFRWFFVLSELAAFGWNGTAGDILGFTVGLGVGMVGLVVAIVIIVGIGVIVAVVVVTGLGVVVVVVVVVVVGMVVVVIGFIVLSYNGFSLLADFANLSASLFPYSSNKILHYNIPVGREMFYYYVTITFLSR
jgi:hypothetical protein